MKDVNFTPKKYKLRPLVFHLLIQTNHGISVSKDLWIQLDFTVPFTEDIPSQTTISTVHRVFLVGIFIITSTPTIRSTRLYKILCQFGRTYYFPTLYSIGCEWRCTPVSWLVVEWTMTPIALHRIRRLLKWMWKIV